MGSMYSTMYCNNFIDPDNVIVEVIILIMFLFLYEKYLLGTLWNCLWKICFGTIITVYTINIQTDRPQQTQ